MTDTQTNVRSRAEYLDWCKWRALLFLDAGDCSQAFDSMTSDLGKHPETQNHPAIELGMMLMMGNHLDAPGKMREFIDGVN